MQAERSNKIISNWVFVGIAMLLIQVLLGGITRLSGSGLSITEWKPIMGALLPSSESEWQKAFQQYQQIAQYKYINNHFILEDFKFIYFWEWFHRLWARLIAVAFVIPFIYFLVKKHIKSWMINPLIVLFLLGGLQGAIGWLMVKSGLNDENVFVNHIKLSIHFVSAMILIAYALIFALSIRINKKELVVNSKLKRSTIILIVVLTIQLFYGAFMAGLKSAHVAPTWPTINGDFLPNSIFKNGLIETLFFNKISVHFFHRTLAYVILCIIILWWMKAKKEMKSIAFNKIKNVPLVLVILQIILGITTLLVSPKIVQGRFGVFEFFALAHQLIGMLLFLSAIICAYLVSGKKN